MSLSEKIEWVNNLSIAQCYEKIQVYQHFLRELNYCCRDTSHCEETIKLIKNRIKNIEQEKEKKKDNEWISVYEKLPKPEKMVEVKFPTRHSIVKITKLKQFGFDISGIRANVCGYQWDLKYCCEYCVPTHWRTIPEKRPDFSNLKEGDFIIVYFDNKETTALKFIKYDKEDDRIVTDRLFDFSTSRIKKVTRINIEKQTFEEI